MGLAVLGGAVAFAVQTSQGGQLSEVHAGLRAHGVAISAYHLRNGAWPKAIEQYLEQEQSGQWYSDKESRDRNFLLDPWQNEYRYHIGRVTCLGADGRSGGSGLAGDHVWNVERTRCSCGSR